MKMTIDLDEKKVAALLISGIESRGGIDYWAEVVSFRKPRRMPFRFDEECIYKHIDYPMNPGGHVLIREHDPDEGETTHRLNRQAIERGLKVMAEKHPRHFAAFLSEDDDMETSDVFIQCCLLGDVKYG